MMLCRNFRFKKPSLKRKYMQIIQFIADHDGCSRRECTVHIWKNVEKYNYRGYQSEMYANLIWKDFIRYDKKFKYHVTEHGLKLLKDAYINDLIEICLKFA